MRTVRAWMSVAVISALMAAACASETSDDDARDADDSADADREEAPASDDGASDADTSSEPGSTAADAVYRLALFSDPATDNPWAALDTEADIWTSYVIPGQGSLYTYQGPTYTLVPLLAEDAEPPLPAADGDGFAVTVSLRSGVTWSDGSPMTARDMEFTFDTLVKYDGLGGSFPSVWPLARSDDPDTEDDESSQGVSAVEALDDATVRIAFNFDPGLAVWPFSVGLAPIFQEAHWKWVVDESPDAETFYSVPGMGSPNGSSFNTVEREGGAFWRNEAVSDYWDTGSRFKVFESGAVEYTPAPGDTEGGTPAPGDAAETWGGEPDGDVLADYVEGPYVSEMLYSVYTDQNAAVLALTEGEVDFMLNPLGLQSGLRNKVLAAPGLDVAVNEENGFRYLAFNTRKFPMSELSFRKALTCRIDKEFMADSVLGGSAIPVDSLVPPGQAFWHNPGIAAPCAGLSERERLESAVAALREAGWTWGTEPAWDEENRDVIPKGDGLRGPDGDEVPPLTLLAPGPGYDPMRATYSLFIEEWADDLGIPVSAEPTGFSVITDKVFTGDALGWDMYILGWSVTPFPDHVFKFFVSSADSAEGGFNTPGYSNPDFDALAEQFQSVKTLEEARDLVHRGDEIIARDLPYATLFTTPVIEAYSNRLGFPFTTVLDGLQAFGGMGSAVRID